VLRPLAFGLVIVAALIIRNSSVESASLAPPSVSEVPRGDDRAAGAPSRPVPSRRPDAAAAASATEADGALPGGVTVFEGSYPGIANLDPDLLLALRAATTDAADEGLRLDINSGWRSRAYQDRLLLEAVADYGSTAEAARWVATADTSPHVSGDAVDVGSAGAAWLAEHGAGYGLCRVYRNEPWHFELRPAAVGDRCPRLYADPTRDPRMRQTTPAP
jgi:hypothetical protein